MLNRYAVICTLLVIFLLSGCAGGGGIPADAVSSGEVTQEVSDDYVIGPGDALQVFVWGHPDLTIDVAVRPDGAISTPLVEDIQAAGNTPTELARIIEETLAEFIRTPNVTVIVSNFVGQFDSQIRVVGQATQPQSLNYREGMTVLDVVIEVGGLAEFAAGNKARIVRKTDDGEQTIRVRLNDLINKGRMDQNVRMQPGDVLIIPESFF
ncbi:MAG: XrtA/PEP-CTERM system exopolysaccharide export protein [Pseudomonadota bacterium]